jgi:hypothetical protein
MKLRRNRKGMGWEALAGIILVLSATIIIILWVNGTLGSLLGRSDRDICKTSVIANSYAVHLSDKLMRPECRTYNIRFYNDHVEISGKTAEVFDERANKKVKSFSSLTDQIVNNVMAEELRLCWQQYGEGKIKFGSSMLGFWNSQGDNCFICDEIYFDPDVKQEKFSGFFDYIKSKNIPDGSKTYYQYIADNYPERVYDSDTYKGTDKSIWEQFADGIGPLSFLKTGKWGERKPVERNIIFERSGTYIVLLDREGDVGKLGIRGSDEETAQGVDTTQTLFSYVIDFEKTSGICDYVGRGSVK